MSGRVGAESSPPLTFLIPHVSLMRRLPVYLVLDCSESMVGEPIQAIDSGIQAMLRQLRSDPQALETAWLSIITFSAGAKVLMPLTELYQFQMPKLTLGSGTALRAALTLLEQRVAEEVRKSTPDRRGDYKPIIFVLTDGDPTDEWEPAADRFKREFGQQRATVVAVLCGEDTSPGKMRRITDQVVLAKNLDDATLKTVFNWVSASISSASQSVESPNRIQLGKDEALKEAEEADFSRSAESDKNVFLHSRCLKNSQLYIMKYRREGRASKKASYQSESSHAVSEFDFGKSDAADLKIASDRLFGQPPCTYCSNHLWAMCSCGRIHCAPDCSRGATLTCPWCKTTDHYGPAKFSVGRGAG